MKLGRFFVCIALILWTMSWEDRAYGKDAVGNVDSDRNSSLYTMYSLFYTHPTVGYKYRLNQNWFLGGEGTTYSLAQKRTLVGDKYEEYGEPIEVIKSPNGSTYSLTIYGQYFFSRRGNLKLITEYAQSHYRYSVHDADTQATLSAKGLVVRQTMGLSLGHEWRIGMLYLGFEWIRLEKFFFNFKEDRVQNGPSNVELSRAANGARSFMRSQTHAGRIYRIQSLIQLGINF